MVCLCYLYIVCYRQTIYKAIYNVAKPTQHFQILKHILIYIYFSRFGGKFFSAENFYLIPLGKYSAKFY